MKEQSHLPSHQNFLGLESDHCDPVKARVIILPVPFEKTSTFGAGSHHGPEAILSASRQVELFDTELGHEPYRDTGGIATLVPLDIRECHGAEVADRLQRVVGYWLQHKKFMITLGGEHTSVVGAIRAHCRIFTDLTILQLDAHSDLRPEYQGSTWNHACTMARVLDFHDDLIQVGIRSQSGTEREIATDRGIFVSYAHEIHRQAAEGIHWTDRIIDATHSNVYISLDCDVFDPAIIPATGTPEPGGLTWGQIEALMAALCEKRQVVGMDVSELAPVAGVSYSEFTMAKLIYRFIGYRFNSKFQPDSMSSQVAIQPKIDLDQG